MRRLAARIVAATALAVAGLCLALAALVGATEAKVERRRRFAHPAMDDPLADAPNHTLAEERALLMIEPAWRIRVVEAEELSNLAQVEYDASLWRATISVRAGLSPAERAYFIRHELIELGLWEYGERVGELIDLFVPAQERAFWHRHHAHIRNRTVERFGQVVTRAEDGSWRQHVSTPRLCPPGPEQRAS